MRCNIIVNYALKTDYQRIREHGAWIWCSKIAHPDGFGHIYGSTAVGSYALYNAKQTTMLSANWNTAVGSPHFDKCLGQIYYQYSCGYDALYNNTTGGE